MPLVKISIPEGSLTPEQKALMVAELTNACVET